MEALFRNYIEKVLFVVSLCRDGKNRVKRCWISMLLRAPFGVRSIVSNGKIHHHIIASRALSGTL